MRQALRQAAWALVMVGGAAGGEVPAHLGGGYVAEGALSYRSPPPPAADSAEGRADLDAVRAAQSADEARRQQAFEDAGAYPYDQLMTRFSLAAGTRLNPATRPVLAYMLKRLLIDTGNYVGDGKGFFARPRPYKEDPAIVPCQTDYLYPTDRQAYPSGHAANGEVAARLIAAVMEPGGEPDRRPGLLARGQRYGDNRVVCGAHHPSDVAEGRRIGAHVFEAAALSPDFAADLACAREENRRSVAVRQTSAAAPFSLVCQKIFERAVQAVTAARD